MRPDELPQDRELAELLAHLDHPRPEISVDSVIERAHRRPAAHTRLRWAAGVLLALGLGVGAAWAAPGSPLPALLREAARRLGVEAPVGEGPQTGPDAEAAGVALEPEVAVTIQFLGARLDGYVLVRLTDDAQILVSAPSRSTRFTSEPERLLVEHPSADTMQISVPRGALSFAVRVGARTVFSMRAGEVVTESAELTGRSWLIPLEPSGR